MSATETKRKRTPKTRQPTLPSNVVEFRPTERLQLTVGRFVALADKAKPNDVYKAFRAMVDLAQHASDAGNDAEFLGYLITAGALVTRYIFDIRRVPPDRDHCLGEVQIGTD